MALLPLHIYIDESGDFNFSPSGSRFYTFTAVITHSPWLLNEEITKRRYSILSGEELLDLGTEYLEDCLCKGFHASEDKQPVRDVFFGLISSLEVGDVLAHSIVVRKNKANPSIQAPHDFYSKMSCRLLDYVFKRYQYSKLCIFVDHIPVKKNRAAFLGAMKKELKSKNPRKEYRIFFPESSSSIFLQIADYINWAVFKKWERGDLRSYDLIKKFLPKGELDIFEKGDKEYYHFKKV